MSHDLERLLGRPLAAPVRPFRRAPRAQAVTRVRWIQNAMVGLHDLLVEAEGELSELSDADARRAKKHEVLALRRRLAAEIEALRTLG